ncbi:MAG: hypothetical protein WAM14_20520 [Candidatus Nitrosopolaris sp.]
MGNPIIHTDNPIILKPIFPHSNVHIYNNASFGALAIANRISSLRDPLD